MEEKVRETTYGRTHTTLVSFWNKNKTSESLSLSFLFAPATKLYCPKKNCTKRKKYKPYVEKYTKKAFHRSSMQETSLGARRILGFGLCFLIYMIQMQRFVNKIAAVK